MNTREIIAKAGGAIAVARLCNVSHQAVYKWRSIPPQHVTTLAPLVGMTYHQMRPDVFPPDAA